MKATIRKRGRSSLTQKGATTASKLIKVNPEQAVVEHLQAAVAGIERLPLLAGRLGCQFLDCLEFTDKFRTRYRDRVKQLLSKSPDAIPGWHVSDTPTRRLSGDTVKVFETLEGELTPEEFMAACSTSLTALRKAFAERNPEWTADELEHVLNRVLVDLVSYDTVTRLSRSKDKQIELVL